MIRVASTNDIPRLIEMGRRFFLEASVLEPVMFDDDSFSRTLNKLITDEGGSVFVAEEDTIIGFIGGMVYPMFFNAAHLTGQEMFWWVEPDHRKGAGGKLRGALEEWARVKGAKSFTMVALESNRPEAVAAIYKRVGYMPTEHHFMRQL